jgi:hypothetical protein
MGPLVSSSQHERGTEMDVTNMLAELRLVLLCYK